MLKGILVVGNRSVVVGLVAMEDKEDEELLLNDVVVIVTIGMEVEEEGVVSGVEVDNGVDELVVRGVLLEVVGAGVDLDLITQCYGDRRWIRFEHT